MALPATIGSAATTAGSMGHGRAVVRRASAAYVFAFEGSSPFTVRCYKSTNPGTVAFAGVGTGGEQNVGVSAINIAAYDDGSLIHVSVTANSGLWYLVFDPASDTWTTKETVLSSGVTSGQTDIAVRSDGQPVIGYNVSGQVVYARRTGVNTWSTGNTVNGSTPAFSGLVLGASDRIHFFYVSLATFRHRTLKSDNTLATEQTIVASGITSGSALGLRPGRHVKTGGVVGLICGVCPTTGTAPTVLVGDSADSPSWSTTATATDGACNAFANSPPGVCNGNGDNEYVTYIRAGFDAPYLATRAVGGAFGTDVSVGASPPSRLLGSVPYWTGSAWKLASCYVNANTPTYNETSITGPTPPVTYTDTPAASVAVTATAGESFGPPPPTPLSEVIAASHTAAVLVEVLEGGEVVDELDTVIDGTVTLDQTAASRGRCDIALVDDGSLGLVPNDAGDLLAPYGNELRISRGVIHADDTIEYVRLGVFRIEMATVDDAPGSLLIRIAGLDRSARIIDARFEEPYQVVDGTNYTTAIEDVIAAAYPDVVTDLTATTRTAPQLIAQEGDDRWAFAQDMARAIGMTLYFDGDGTLVLRPVSAAGQTPVAVLAEGEDGLLVQASRAWTRQGAFNRVIATGENTGLTAPARGVATDDNPLSPTYYYGPFGKVPRFYASPFITTDEQAVDAAQAILARELGTTESVDFGSIVNPALKPDDVVSILRERAGIDEDHIIDSVTIPLTVEGGMSGKTRATQVNAGTVGS